MKIGWYTHHLEREQKPLSDTVTGLESASGDGLFQGRFAGGAEMSDYEYKQAAPDGYDIFDVSGSDWIEPDEFDSVVVTGTESFSDQQLLRLAEFDPFVFVHHLQTPRASLQTLINNARIFVTHTPAHMTKELTWTNPKQTGQVLSYFDTSVIKADENKERLALWAGRNHPLKGELAAWTWASKMEIPFIPMSNKPREEVLQAMSYAEYFVHLPLAFESECRAVMEAVLSGCKIVTNENVGITSVEDWEDPDALRNMIDKAGHTFWKLVQL